MEPIMEKEQLDALSLEETLARLEAVVDTLNDSDCTLEESFALYRQGMELLKAGNEKIDRVEKKMLEINQEGEAHEFFGGAQ